MNIKKFLRFCENFFVDFHEFAQNLLRAFNNFQIFLKNPKTSIGNRLIVC